MVGFPSSCWLTPFDHLHSIFYDQGIAAALKQAPRDVRCLLWLAALHVLVMGVFPRHVLVLADYDSDCKSSGTQASDSRDRRSDLLLWPKEWMCPKGGAGVRLSASAELRDATTKIFMSALQDAGLLPSEGGRGSRRSGGAGGWAPPLRIRDALLPSAVEAKAARAGGMAPEPSALEGPPLVLALNWLTYCSRGGKGQMKQVRMVAFACCRRFQLTRPDHPAMLEHLLLEHDVSKARSLNDIYGEISLSFDGHGAAVEASRERSEEPPHPEDGDSGGGGDNKDPSLLSPSEARLQAIYTFLRFAEVRLQSGGSMPVVGAVLAGPSSAANPDMNVADRDLEAARELLRELLVGLWTVNPGLAAHSGKSKGAADWWLRGEGGESLRRALEGAKSSLFHWADGSLFTHAWTDSDQVQFPAGNARLSSPPDALSAQRQLSTIVFALWVLGGPSAATSALDHLLNAESFSNMSPERRRLAWLQRLETAVVLSDEQVWFLLSFLLVIQVRSSVGSIFFLLFNRYSS